jgi:hypothetical protein
LTNRLRLQSTMRHTLARHAACALLAQLPPRLTALAQVTGVTRLASWVATELSVEQASARRASTAVRAVVLMPMRPPPALHGQQSSTMTHSSSDLHARSAAHATIALSVSTMTEVLHADATNVGTARNSERAPIMPRV